MLHGWVQRNIPVASHPQKVGTEVAGVLAKLAELPGVALSFHSGLDIHAARVKPAISL